MFLILFAAAAVAEPLPVEDTDAVRAALELIGDPAPPKEYLVSISRSDGETWVRFSAPVRFVPWMSEAYYEVTAALESGLLYFSSLRSPEEYRSGCVVLSFYTPSPEDREKIGFVAGALADRWGFDFRSESPAGRLTVREQENEFRIELVSEFQESWYTIDKVSGRISGEGHAHLEPEPEKQETP